MLTVSARASSSLPIYGLSASIGFIKKVLQGKIKLLRSNDIIATVNSYIEKPNMKAFPLDTKYMIVP